MPLTLIISFSFVVIKILRMFRELRKATMTVANGGQNEAFNTKSITSEEFLGTLIGGVRFGPHPI